MSTGGDPGRMVPRRVGRYEIGREVGRGGMAAVYVARQIDLDRVVALKELRVFRTVEPSFAQRFLREARLAGSFSHPNIVTVHDYFEDDGLPYIAMEFLPRGSLRPHVGRVSLAQAGGVLEGVLAGLAHAERRQVVHRDIKPENLLVTAEGGVKIADFGIAKATVALESDALLTATGTTVGTPNYIAPEQAMARELGPWTDLYSVGMTAFELFAGRAPFADTQEPMAIVLRQVNEPVPRLSHVAPHVGRWMSDWVGWLVAKNPAARPRSAAQAWDALEEMLIAELGPRWRHQAQLLEPGTGASPTSGRPTRRRVAPALAATVPPRKPMAEAAPVATRRRRFPRLLATAAAVAVLAVAGLALTAREGPQLATPAASAESDPPSTAPEDMTVAPTALPEPAGAGAALSAQVAPAENLAQDYAAAANRIEQRKNVTPADAQLAAALRQVGQDYAAAAAAADRGNLPAYTDAITAANAGSEALAGKVDVPAPSGPTPTPAPAPATKPTPTTTAAQPPASTQPAPAPAAPTQPVATQPASPCQGDSASDDPSDDECGES